MKIFFISIGQWFLPLLLINLVVLSTMSAQPYRKLSEEEKRVILDKGTELPFSGKYNNFFNDGTYHCKQCDAKLFASDSKFQSSCGWPSFDEALKDAVRREPDADGRRTEILCARCGAHLGHVFTGERLTEKNTRHCVNSISMVFKAAPTGKQQRIAYFAGGCFWGVEYLFEEQKGVLSATSGYMGGMQGNPSYRDVSNGGTGHYETVRVLYDPTKTSYEKLARFFFEIHDPTQRDGQGPDIGEQYMSVIFYSDDEEKKVAQSLIAALEKKGYDIATKMVRSSIFWKAEEYHQNYYKKNRKAPYCHHYEKKF